MRKYVVGLIVAGIVAIGLLAAIAKRDVRVSPPAIIASVPITMSKNIVVRAGAARPSAHTGWSPQIARTGSISLFVDDPQKAANTIGAIAQRYGGQIFSLEFASGGANMAPSAQMEIRVPVDRYEPAVNAVAAIGKVRSRTESAQDLTGDIADSRGRLVNLERTEGDIRKIMDRSGSVDEILGVENQLSQVREQIQTLESEMQTMGAQVTYSTLDVTLQTEAATVPVEASPASQLAQAWQNAVHALVGATVAFVSVALLIGVFVPYAAIVLAIAALVFRRRVRA